MSFVTAKALRERRANLAKQAQEFVDKANAESRIMSAEEMTAFDAIHAESEQLKGQIDRIEKQEDLVRDLESSKGRLAGGKDEPGTQPTGSPEPVRFQNIQETRDKAMRAWFLRGSDQRPTDDQLEAARRLGIDVQSKQITFNLATRALRSTDREGIREWQERAQSIGTGSEGGFSVPDEAMRALEVSLLAFGGMRQVADIIRTSSGADLPWPTMNDTSQKGVILGESTQVANQDLVFGQMVLNAFKYSSKQILVSVELLQDSSVNVGEVVGSALGTRIGRITNDHFTTGTGSGQPNGVVTASGQGKVGATGQTTSIIYDDLVDLLHSVDPEYRDGARWMFHDSTLKALKKIKTPQFSGDTAGLPLWQPGIALREPDTILGYPYTINQSMPVMAASAKSVLFGSLNKYKVRDVRDVTLLRLDERYADFHQVAFIAFSRHDGDLLDAGTDPVKHYANAAS